MPFANLSIKDLAYAIFSSSVIFVNLAFLFDLVLL